MTIEQEMQIFNDITDTMRETFASKRADYGQTTTETFEKFGPVSLIVRMYDKLGRLDNLLVRSNKTPRNETVKDTLLDLANYAIITLIELEKVAQNKCSMPAD